MTSENETPICPDCDAELEPVPPFDWWCPECATRWDPEDVGAVPPR